MGDSSIEDIIKHKQIVAQYMCIVAMDLFQRAVNHDNSKFSPQEYSVFDKMLPRLQTLTYGSEEYQQVLVEMRPALEHHYQKNNHHPEHYQDGIHGMSLIDLIEMICDWIAATQRVQNGDVFTSLQINQKRYGIDDQLTRILRNTLVDIQTHEQNLSSGE